MLTLPYVAGKQEFCDHTGALANSALQINLPLAIFYPCTKFDLIKGSIEISFKELFDCLIRSEIASDNEEELDESDLPPLKLNIVRSKPLKVVDEPRLSSSVLDAGAIPDEADASFALSQTSSTGGHYMSDTSSEGVDDLEINMTMA